MTKICDRSIIFTAVGLKLTCSAILLSWLWPERASIPSYFGTALACVAGAKRGRGGGREKGKIPLPFFPSSLSRTPYPFRRLLRRLTPTRSLLPVIKRSFRSFWEGETPCGWMLLSISAVGRQIFSQRPTRTVKTWQKPETAHEKSLAPSRNSPWTPPRAKTKAWAHV